MLCATAQVQSQNTLRSLGPITKNITGQEHGHVRGHSSYTNIKILLQRNDIRDHDDMNYLGQTIESRTHRTGGVRGTASLRGQPRKVTIELKDTVSLSSMEKCSTKLFELTTFLGKPQILLRYELCREVFCCVWCL